MTKMTTRKMLEAVIARELTDEIIDYARNQLAKLDEQNAARSSKNASRKAAENAPLMEAIVNALKETGGGFVSDFAETVGATSSKVSALCAKMAEAGTLTREYRKGKSGGKYWYAVA